MIWWPPGPIRQCCGRVGVRAAGICAVIIVDNTVVDRGRVVIGIILRARDIGYLAASRIDVI
jgi:hypothetical protein